MRPDPYVPRLAEGLELIGEYEGSGFKETPYLARRMDGQVLQLTRLLYLVAEAADGERDFGGVAKEVTEKFGRTVSADNVKFLVEKKLRPLGVLAAADGSSPKLKKADPVLALKLRTRLVPERAVRAITTLFYPLFHWPVVLAVLAGLVGLDAWLFFVHGVAQSARDIAYQPALFLMVFGLIVVSAAFHECGHATACRFGGAKPGAMGAGIYLVYPAFFSDVTDVYRLGKWGRVRTDLGGIYFNMIFSLLTAGAYFLTGFEPLLAIIVIQHLEMLHQLLPFLRLDGYYVVSDITGVPDLFARIRPILRSVLAPWREPDAAVTALKPWVRIVVTAWVLSVVPILLYLLATIVVAVPRLLATVWDSLLVQYDKAAGALSDGEVLATIAGAIQMIFLVLPLAGLTYTLGLLGKRLGVAAWTRTEGKPILRTGLASTALVSFSFLTLAWWPGELYEPIRPDERGAVQDSLKAVDDTVQEGLENLDELEEYVPEVVRPSLADELQDSLESIEEGLDSIEEYIPVAVRPSLAPDSRQGQDDNPATGEQSGSSSTGTGASGPDGTPGDPASGALSDGPDELAPAGEEEPSGAQEGEQDEPMPAREEQPSDAPQSKQDAREDDDAGTDDDPDYAPTPAPELELDEPEDTPEPPEYPEPAPTPEEPEPAPAPPEPEEPEPSTGYGDRDYGGSYDHGGDSDGGYGYDRGGSDYGSGNEGSGYNRSGDDDSDYRSDDDDGSSYDRGGDDGYDGYGR